MKWCEKMGAEMGALVLNRKLSASMKKWVKISTSKRFLDHAPPFPPPTGFVKAAPIPGSPAPFSETLFGELARNIRALHTKMCYFFNFAWRTHTLLNFKNLPPPFPPPFSSPWKSSESALQLFILSCMLKMHSLRCTNPMHKNKSDSRLCKEFM